MRVSLTPAITKNNYGKRNPSFGQADLAWIDKFTKSPRLIARYKNLVVDGRIKPQDVLDTLTEFEKTPKAQSLADGFHMAIQATKKLANLDLQAQAAK